MNLATGVLFISLILSCIYISSSEKILYISTVGCKSTASLHFVLSQILINHGHEIVAVSPFPRKGISNYSDIDVHNYFYIYSDKFSINDNVVGTFTNLKLSFETQYQTCKKIYEDKKITNLIKKKKIDLVMMEVDGTDCLLPFVLQFHVPIIGVSTSGIMYADFDGLMGNPVNPSYIPTVMSGFSSKMNFIQRLFNTQNFIVHWLINFYYNRKANILIEKHLKSPPIEELYDKFSLIFYNSHFTFLPKPVAPNSIGIAGIHIQKPSPLPQEIKNFIDAADNGVIYVSLGSVVQFSGLPKQIHGAFVNAFQKLPYRVIWRHDKPEMVPNSKKFFVRYWLPQKKILAEKKIILFISHNGMFSTHEAIHNGIPILSFPVIYDQFTNAAISQNLGIAKSADLRQLNESLLIEYINEVIQDKKYRENMNRVSNTFRDRPQSPEDTFIYWVEYVLKHKNVSFLKPIGSSLPFYQYLLLDVILFITFVIYSLIWIISQLIKFSCNCTGKKRLSKVPEKLD